MTRGRIINAVLHFLAAADRLDCRNPYFAGAQIAELCRGYLLDRHRDSWAYENVEGELVKAPDNFNARTVEYRVF